MPTNKASRAANDAVTIDWIETLAEPYLRGYRAQRQSNRALQGWWFRSPRDKSQGFFVGYLLQDSRWKFLQPDPPECMVFAFVEPLKGARHRRLVAAKDSPVRKIFEYIRWLTHRPPRFRFFDDQLPAMIRHTSMRGWPEEKYEHYSRNFFIETLAWLVRSGLVKKLAASPAARGEKISSLGLPGPRSISSGKRRTASLQPQRNA